MSDKTNIGWCDSTINPVMGCDGCELWDGEIKICYAGILHDRHGGSKGYAPTFLEPTPFPSRMAKAAKWKDLTGTDRPDKPWLNGKPRLIFISDMADALSAAITFEFLRDEIFPAVNNSPHQWLWLTKRPARMAKFAKFVQHWPHNLWAGTSITDQHTADMRIPQLLKIPAKIRFLSVEPLLEQVDLGGFLSRKSPIKELPDIIGVGWLIVGGESGPSRRDCGFEAIVNVAEQCKSAGVPCFVKQDVAFKPGQQGRIPNDIWAMKQFPALETITKL